MKTDGFDVEGFYYVLLRLALPGLKLFGIKSLPQTHQHRIKQFDNMKKCFSVRQFVGLLEDPILGYMAYDFVKSNSLIA